MFLKECNCQTPEEIFDEKEIEEIGDINDDYLNEASN